MRLRALSLALVLGCSTHEAAAPEADAATSDSAVGDSAAPTDTSGAGADIGADGVTPDDVATADLDVQVLDDGGSLEDVATEDVGSQDVADTGALEDTADGADVGAPADTSDGPDLTGPIEGGSPGQPGYTILGGCAVPKPWVSPGCDGVTCGADEVCTGNGACVPTTAFWADDSSMVQGWPAVATREDGGFAVVWSAGGFFDGEQKGRLRVFADGTAAGGAVLPLSDDTDETERAASVASMEDGSWLVMWRSESFLDNTNRYRARRFVPDGTGPADEPFDVSTTPLLAVDGSSNVIQPVVVRLRNDDLIMAWSGMAAPDAPEGTPQGLGVWARLFDSKGLPLTAEIPLSAFGDSDEATSISIARMPTGVAFVVWQNRVPGSKNAQRLRGRVVRGDGTLGPTLSLSPGELPYEALPAVTAYEDGSVLLMSKVGSNADATDAVEIRAKRFAPGLSKAFADPDSTGATTLDLDDTGHYPGAPPVAVLSEERAVTVWHNQGDSLRRIWLSRHYLPYDVWDCERTDAGGPWLGGEVFNRYLPALAAWPDGHFVLAFTTQLDGMDMDRIAVRVFPW